MNTWFEDFVDEDTGEVVSIERNEIILDRETVLEKEHLDLILESGVKQFLSTKKTEMNSLLSRTLYKKTLPTPKRSGRIYLQTVT